MRTRCRSIEEVVRSLGYFPTPCSNVTVSLKSKGLEVCPLEKPNLTELWTWEQHVQLG